MNKFIIKRKNNGGHVGEITLYFYTSTCMVLDFEYRHFKIGLD